MEQLQRTVLLVQVEPIELSCRPIILVPVIQVILKMGLPLAQYATTHAQLVLASQLTALLVILLNFASSLELLVFVLQATLTMESHYVQFVLTPAKLALVLEFQAV